MNTTRKLTIAIASPLEDEHVQRIRAFDPARFEVIHEPDLLPKPRYVADHNGAPRTMTQAETARWQAILQKADILFDFDKLDAAAMPRNAPNLKWVQWIGAVSLAGTFPACRVALSSRACR